MNTQPFFREADTFARELANRDVDPNEVAKCFTHLRTFWRRAGRDEKTQQKAIQEWWTWLETISGSAAWTVVRSKRTTDYYAHLYRAANTHLKALEPEPLVEAFGWSVRLLRYYRTHPEARQQPSLFEERKPIAKKRKISKQASQSEEMLPKKDANPIAQPVTTEEPAKKVAEESTKNVMVEPSATPKTSEEPTPEPVTAKEATPEPIVSEEATPKPVVTEKATPEPIVSEEATPEPIVSEEATPEPIVSEEATPEPIVSEQATPESIVSEQATPESLVTEEVTPKTKKLFPQGEQLTCLILDADESAVILELKGFDPETQALGLIRPKHFGTGQYHANTQRRVEVIKMWHEQSGRMIVEMKPVLKNRRKKKKKKKKR